MASDADAFFIATCNGVGDCVVGGTTGGVSSANAVIVLNGERVLLREGDPIDLDGNGLFDEGLFYRFFGTDDFRLTDSGLLLVGRDRPAGRYVGPGQIQNSGSAGTFSLAIDLTTIPSPTGPVARARTSRAASN